MKAHRTDLLSLTFSLIFLAAAACWLLARLLGFALPPVGWFLAGTLILIGVLGLLGALRSGRSSSAGAAPTAPGVDGGPASESLPEAGGPADEPLPEWTDTGTGERWPADEPVTGPPARPLTGPPAEPGGRPDGR